MKKSLYWLSCIFIWQTQVAFAQSVEIDLGEESATTSSESTADSKGPSNDSATSEESVATQKKSDNSAPPEATSEVNEKIEVSEESAAEEKSVETATEDQGIEIDFFRPEYGEAEGKNRRPIVISGKTEPGTRVTVKTPQIPRFSKKTGQVEVFKLNKKNTSQIPTRANSEGLFYFKLYVPEGQYQIPLVFKTNTNGKLKKRIIQISFKVETQQVQLAGNESAKGMKASPFLTKKNHISLGLGANILVYQKKNTDDAASMDVGFSSVKAPALFFEYWRKFTEKLELAVNYKYSPGETTSAANNSITVSNGVYAWTTIAADGIYYPHLLAIKKEKSYNIRGGIRFGFQYHSTPFLRRKTSATEFEMTNNQVTMVALGYQFEYEPSPEWRYEAFMRYQHPLSAGSKFKLKPQFAFDGSMGVQRNLSGHRWSLGAFWYGQWHSYKTNEYDSGVQLQTTSTQMLFFSNVEARLIYHF